MIKTTELPVRRSNVPLRVARGHFATNHSHINYYIDITSQKIRLAEAKAVARALAANFSDTRVDTILCLDGMTLIGSCLAEALTDTLRTKSVYEHIAVIEPEFNAYSQMIFRDNVQPYVRGKNVLILMASISTGYTAKRGVQAVRYYGGTVVGAAGLFRDIDELEEPEYKVYSVFSKKDLPDYKSCDYRDCPMCKEGKPLDALVNSYGYSEI